MSDDLYSFLLPYCTAAQAADPEDSEPMHALAAQLQHIAPATAAPDATLLAVTRTLLEERGLLRPDALDQVQWACWAYHAAQQLYGDENEDTKSTAIRLADVLQEAGQLNASIDVRRSVIHLKADEPDDRGMALQRMALAGTLHANGACEEAFREASATLNQWIPRDVRDRATYGKIMMLKYLTYLQECGRVGLARTVLHDHRGLLPVHGELAWETMVIAVRRDFGDPDRIAAHRQICGTRPDPAPAPATTSPAAITTTAHLILDFLGDGPDTTFPLMRRRLEQFRLGGAGIDG